MKTTIQKDSTEKFALSFEYENEGKTTVFFDHKDAEQVIKDLKEAVLWIEENLPKDEPEVDPIDAKIEILLENQRVWNATSKNDERTNKLLLGTVEQTFRKLGGLYDLISIVPLKGPNEEVSYFNFCYDDDSSKLRIVLKTASELVTSKSRKLKTFLETDSTDESIIQKASDGFAKEIVAEVLMDLRNNAGTVSRMNFAAVKNDSPEVSNYELFYIKFIELSGIVHRQTLKSGINWIVASPDMISLMEIPSFYNLNYSAVGPLKKLGVMGGVWALYEYEHLGPNTILMGRKGKSDLDSGYFYCPHIGMVMPVCSDAEMCCPRPMTRYGKKLVREGAKNYLKLTVEGLE